MMGYGSGDKFNDHFVASFFNAIVWFQTHWAHIKCRRIAKSMCEKMAKIFKICVCKAFNENTFQLIMSAPVVNTAPVSTVKALKYP